MKPETCEAVLDAVDKMFADVGRALGTESSGYEDGIRFISVYGKKTVFEVCLEGVERFTPFIFGEQTLTSETIALYLDAMSTRDRAAQVLSNMPEPDPVLLSRALGELQAVLFGVRQVLLPFAKQLPIPPGGRKKLFSEQQENEIRQEVGAYWCDGWSLPLAKKKVAKRRLTSLSTIDRICRKGTIYKETKKVK